MSGVKTKSSPADYSNVTEVPGLRITREGVALLRSRYAFAADFCAGKRVLEVGCGAGIGLNYLARYARSIVGGDYTGPLLRGAQQELQHRCPLVQLDAHCLPFRDGSFDIVILFEAIYYLADPAQFVRECRRVLDLGGLLLLCTVNRECSSFNPSPFSKHYLSAVELRQLLREHGFDAEVHGTFPLHAATLKQQWTEKIRRAAIHLRLIPRTMKGKEFLKRLFYGRLEMLGTDLHEYEMRTEPLCPLAPGADATSYKVLYAVGRLQTQVSTADEGPDYDSKMSYSTKGRSTPGWSSFPKSPTKVVDRDSNYSGIKTLNRTNNSARA